MVDEALERLSSMSFLFCSLRYGHTPTNYVHISMSTTGEISSAVHIRLSLLRQTQAPLMQRLPELHLDTSVFTLYDYDLINIRSLDVFEEDP